MPHPFAPIPLRGTELRDVQARERTFLAFMRTAVYCHGAGMILSTSAEGRFVTAVSVVFVTAGLALVLFAATDLIPFVVAVGKGRNPPMRAVTTWAVCAVTIAVMGITVALLVHGEVG